MDVCRKHGMVTNEMEILVGLAGAKFFTPMTREEAIRFYEEEIAKSQRGGG